MTWRVRLGSWVQRWRARQELRAAEAHINELGFRESNGDLVLAREWREAEEWLRKAREM